MENKKIKPCPFCGAEAMLQKKRRHNLSPEKYRIVDTNANCCVYPATKWFSDMKDAINAWNNRAR